MNLRTRQLGQIMWIILGTLFLGGGAATGVFSAGKSIDSIRKDVKALRLEGARQEQVYALLNRWEAIAGPAGEDFNEYGQVLLDLITRQDASKQDFNAVLERQREELKQSEDLLLPLRDELRSALDKEEWDGLFR
jgi:hypothetical protein